MNKFLFVCEENRLRSPTCEHVARLQGIAADSAGTSSSAVRPLTLAAINRAEHIVCMTNYQGTFIRTMAPRAMVTCWDIPDIYDYCQPDLIRIIELRLEEHGRIR